MHAHVPANEDAILMGLQTDCGCVLILRRPPSRGLPTRDEDLGDGEFLPLTIVFEKHGVAVGVA